MIKAEGYYLIQELSSFIMLLKYFKKKKKE